MNKYDRRRKYYLILDCETATLPCAMGYDAEPKKRIAIAKPLIYDLGWTVIDIKGNVYKRASYIISEIFCVPQVFNTAYYASKRPLYLQKLEKGESKLVNWNTAIAELIEDMDAVEAVGAYNSMFDFKKAIPFTNLYIQMLFSPDYFKWEERQNDICKEIAAGKSSTSQHKFEEDIFRFRGKTYPLFDLWGLSCEHLLNNNKYKDTCIEKEWETASGKYFPTNAEKAFAFCFENYNFEEEHMALEDALIESALFALICKITKHNFTRGIEYFPFRNLGTVENYICGGGKE